ncbi:hypothetical protein MRB53_029287 [Persea americana]|uniref:Uncharacterized protein n=1 Tax=Persea americana TaxID=3435 RepID=A0ACC2KIM6_PERAE|nr:hypothetical protein MRB53_029287 [Persea americana]
MILKSLPRRTQPSKTSYLPRPGRHFYKIRATAGPSVAAAPVANMLSPWTIFPALVACPSISDPAEKYMSLIIPAFNEEQRLPGALEDTMKNFLMKGFHLVVLLTAGPGIRDTQCGFKMFTRAAARKLFTNIRLKR